MRSFGRGTLPPEVESLVFSLPVGGVAGPIRTDQGFHIVKVTDRRSSQARPLEEVKDRLRMQLLERAVYKRTQAWLGQLRRAGYVEVRL